MSNKPKEKPVDGSHQKSHVEKPISPRGKPASDHDPKGRLGNFSSAGDHPITQPDGKKGSDH